MLRIYTVFSACPVNQDENAICQRLVSNAETKQGRCCLWLVALGHIMRVVVCFKGRNARFHMARVKSFTFHSSELWSGPRNMGTRKNRFVGFGAGHSGMCAHAPAACSTAPLWPAHFWLANHSSPLFSDHTHHTRIRFQVHSFTFFILTFIHSFSHSFIHSFIHSRTHAFLPPLFLLLPPPPYIPRSTQTTWHKRCLRSCSLWCQRCLC